MSKQIFVINGTGGAGKDTFVKMISKRMDKMSGYMAVMNVSSADKVKDAAKILGWNGGKEEKDRKFLSDLKELSSKYNDMPFEYMKKKVDNFKKSHFQVLFLHIREPEEIRRAVKEFGAGTILLTRDSIKHITSNMADRNVFDYEYDFVIQNNGSMKDLKNKARIFVKYQLNEKNKKEP